MRNSSFDPDEYFFSKKIVRQVRGDTYWRAWKDGFLPKQSLCDIPVFYCGGGMRLKFYDRLRSELRSMQGYTWLSAVPRRIEVPTNLEAPALLREEFDRLSVAYGLSFLEVGKVVRSMPKPRLTSPQESSWRTNYLGR